jgi:hypothetical protein
VKNEPGTAGLPVTDVTCFSTEARCFSIALAIVVRAGSGDVGTDWADIIPVNVAIAKIHLILVFYRLREGNSE